MSGCSKATLRRSRRTGSGKASVLLPDQQEVKSRAGEAAEPVSVPP
jgi:hypothetical protein